MYTGSDCKLKLNKSNLITQNISNNSSSSNINHERNNIFKKQKEKMLKFNIGKIFVLVTYCKIQFLEMDTPLWKLFLNLKIKNFL